MRSQTHRWRFPIVEMPWYTRWTVGVVILLLFVPIAILVTLWETARAAFEAFNDSQTWRLIALAVMAVVMGDRDE